MTRLLTTTALLALCAALAACGGTEYDSSGKPPAEGASAGGEHGGHGGEAGEEADAAGDDAHGEHAGGEDGGHAGHDDGGGQGGSAGDDAEMEGMKTLASSKRGDLAVELHAMEPELFYVSEGDGLRPQRPTKGDDTHLMLTVADRESGVRLPDATVTVRVTRGGKTAFEGPLYPMVGRGMGLHYGENVNLPGKGTYDLVVTVGQPRVGRHRAVAKAWNRPTVVRQQMVYDGKDVRAK